MKKSFILALMGNARVGKDTFAQYVEERLGFMRVGLADPLKRFCRDVFEFTDEQLWGQERDLPDSRYPRACIYPATREVPLSDHIAQREPLVEYLTPRYALQLLGTEWGRNCYENVWIDYGIRVAKQITEGHSYNALIGVTKNPRKRLRPRSVVFSDLRFRNEFEAVKNAGGVLVRIYRNGYDGRNLAGISNHQSEEEQRSIRDEEFDHIIHNPDGLENYFRVIDDLMAGILRSR